MKITGYLSDNKRIVHSILLAIQVISPILMFVGIRNGWLFLVYLGLAALVLANFTAALTK